MSQQQIRQLGALVREFEYAKAENARCTAEIDAGVAKAKQQLATARELLAQLNAILNSHAKQT